jgi:hypothetical protein
MSTALAVSPIPMGVKLLILPLISDTLLDRIPQAVLLTVLDREFDWDWDMDTKAESRPSLTEPWGGGIRWGGSTVPQLICISLKKSLCLRGQPSNLECRTATSLPNLRSVKMADPVLKLQIPVPSTHPYKGKVAVITGGSSGIGLATTILLWSRGASVAIAGISARSIAELDEELESRSKNALPGQRFTTKIVDVSKEDAVNEWIQHTVQEFGRLDFAANGTSFKMTSLSKSLTLFSRSSRRCCPQLRHVCRHDAGRLRRII